jgi:phage baseplate assembly protein W
MATFIGFNTQNQPKKFTLVDQELIKRDLLNAFNIRQGQLPGKPSYGTTIWDNLFENQSDALVSALRTEVQRVVGQDPRVQLTSLEIFAQENGILLQAGLTYVPSTDAQRLAIFFDQQSRTASYV